MKKEEFYFDSRDNASKIHAVRWTPDSGNVVAVVQIVHGMAEYVERYEELAKFLTDRNMVVTGEDHLGHGKTVPEGGIKGYFCEQDPATVVVRDVHRLKKMTQEEYPGVPYFILGHSMGSFILRNYISRYGTGIDGALILGSGFQTGGHLVLAKAVLALVTLCKGPKKESKLLDKMAFGKYNKQISRPKTAYDWLSVNEENVAAYIADENCGFVFTVNGFKTLFALIAGAHKQENLDKIPKELPLYIASGGKDPVGDYGRGVKKVYEFYEEAGIKDITLQLYPEDRHEILHEPDREKVMTDIGEWLVNHLAFHA